MQNQFETGGPLNASRGGAWGWLLDRGQLAHVYQRTRFDLVESLCGTSVGNPRWLYGPKGRTRCPACLAMVDRRPRDYVRAA